MASLRYCVQCPVHTSACSILVDIPATCDNMRPKSFTVLHQASASIPSISKMAGYSAGVEPCLPATVLGREDTPLIDSRILLSFGYRPENDVCPQASHTRRLTIAGIGIRRLVRFSHSLIIQKNDFANKSCVSINGWPIDRGRR